MKRELNKWQFILRSDTPIEYLALGWRRATLGIFKLTSFPEEGTQISRRNYDGFLWRWLYWLPWDRS